MDSGRDAGAATAYDAPMPRDARFRSILGVAALGTIALALAAPTVHGDDAAPAADERPLPTALVSSLGSVDYAERRDAERALYVEGQAVLAALEADAADAASRVAAFDATLLACERSASPAAARAAARVASRLESSATDDQVRRIPRLLEVRLDRVLPFVVLDRGVLLRPGGGARASTAGPSGVSCPRRSASLIERVRTIAAIRACSRARSRPSAPRAARGIDDEADLEAIGAAWAAEPARFREFGRFESVDGAPPIGAVALALALTGRAAELPSLARARRLRRVVAARVARAPADGAR